MLKKIISNGIKLTVCFITVILIAGCIPGPPHGNFIGHMDAVVKEPYYKFSRYYAKIDDIGRVEDILREEERNGLRTIRYKRPGHLSRGSSKYYDDFCFFHIIVDIETEKIVDWGFDMPDSKLRRNVCSTFG